MFSFKYFVRCDCIDIQNVSSISCLNELSLAQTQFKGDVTPALAAP